MLSIRTVLCPVDLSPSTARQVDLAADLCRAFGARLVLHHNRIELAIGSGVGWMWEPGQGDAARTAEAQLQRLVGGLPGDLAVDVQVTHGPVADAVRWVSQAINADLVVLRVRGEDNDGTDSVTDRLLESASLPMVALHDAAHDHRTPKFSGRMDAPQVLLVPTDLGAASQPAVDVAFELSRLFGFEVHLVHVLPPSPDPGTADDVRKRMTALVPPELASRTYPHLETGVPASAIVRLADELSAVCIVMGEHAPTPARHWFRSDTSRAVLHPSSCPIWYVPRRPAVAAAPAKESDQPASLVAELQDTTFRFWPSSYVHGVVDSVEDAESALAEIITAGVPKNQLHTWFGPAGSAAIDPDGRHHGRMARLWRLLEKATPERDLLEQYASEVDAGRVCIGGHIDSPEGARVMADILKHHGGRLISYFSVGAVQHLH
jgi:nucleotide-binding universal stress UspA family protein